MSTTAIDKVKSKPLTQVTNVKELLWNDAAKNQLQQVSAAHMKPDRMMRLMANAIRTTPKLGECDPMSLLGGLMTCAGLGLEPNTIMGHAYLIPFKNNRKGITEVQLVVGYKGLIDLARRSGHITSISANIHYSDDEVWEYEEGTEARLRHIPGAQEGEKRHAYAIAKFRDGGHAYVVLPWAKVIKIRDGSQGWQTAVKYGATDRNPWKSHEDEMAKKTAIRALAKSLPLSVEFRDALTVDGGKADFAAFAINPADQLDATPDDEDDRTIEGEATDLDQDQRNDQKADDAKAVAAPKLVQPQTKPASADKKPDPEMPARGEAEQASAGLIKRILDDLAEADNADAADAVMSLWEDQIATLSQKAQADINTAAANVGRNAE
ncbi:MAG: recombinase RecT [Proteobacteria bacterium]|nr:recombinase RecT [Pseudomonadota bacterium]